MFSHIVAERIGWYVYALRDPRDRRVFYIGKGKGNRVFQHAKAELDAVDGASMSSKLETIRGIRQAGLEVDAYILRHGILTERQAYEVEAAVIDILLLTSPELDNSLFVLTNLVRGWNHATRGLVHVDVVTSVYDAPPAPAITEPSMIFRIPRLWTPQMPAGVLYEATQGWWKVGPRRDAARYAFSVSKGVVRAVYRINCWRERREGDRDWQHDLGKRPRWGFDGSPAPEMHQYINTSVAHLFVRGEAGVVKYVNC